MPFNDENANAIEKQFAINGNDVRTKPTGELIAGGAMMLFLTAGAMYAQTPLAIGGLIAMSVAYGAKIQEYLTNG